MVISTDAEGVSDEVQQSFMIKRLSKVGRGGAFLSQGDSKKPPTNTTLNSDRMLSSTGQEQQHMCLYHFHETLYWRSQAEQ